jgi:hypothetical protein
MDPFPFDVGPIPLHSSLLGAIDDDINSEVDDAPKAAPRRAGKRRKPEAAWADDDEGLMRALIGTGNSDGDDDDDAVRFAGLMHDDNGNVVAQPSADLSPLRTKSAAAKRRRTNSTVTNGLSAPVMRGAPIRLGSLTVAKRVTLVSQLQLGASVDYNLNALVGLILGDLWPAARPAVDATICIDTTSHGASAMHGTDTWYVFRAFCALLMDRYAPPAGADARVRRAASVCKSYCSTLFSALYMAKEIRLDVDTVVRPRRRKVAADNEEQLRVSLIADEGLLTTHQLAMRIARENAANAASTARVRGFLPRPLDMGAPLPPYIRRKDAPKCLETLKLAVWYMPPGQRHAGSAELLRAMHTWTRLPVHFNAVIAAELGTLKAKHARAIANLGPPKYVVTEAASRVGFELIKSALAMPRVVALIRWASAFVATMCGALREGNAPRAS